MIKQILKLGTGRNAIIALLIFLLFTAFALPYFASISQERVGSSESPDTSFLYRAEDLYRMAEDYGQDGRDYYIINRWTFDVLWPLIYGSFLVLSTAYFVRKNNPKLSSLIYLPLLAVALDFGENLGASIVFYRYPSPTPIVDIMTPLFTSGKWIVLGISFLVLIMMSIIALYSKVKSYRKGF